MCVAQLGVLQPILVRGTEEPGRYRLVAGARRLAAARLAGLTAVPCVQIPPDANAAAVCAAENLAREDIRPLEASEQVLAMQAAGMTIEAVALAVGKPLYWVRRAAQLAKLSDEAWAQVRKNPGLSLLFLARLAAMTPALQDIVCARFAPHVFEDAGDHAELKRIADQHARAIALTPWLANDPDCPDCPKRSDVQPDLFGDDPIDPSCCDPICCERKRCEFIETRLFAAKKEAKKLKAPEPITEKHTNWNDAKKRDATHTQPVVVTEGPHSGAILWRAEATEGKTEGKTDGPTPAQRMAARYIRDLDKAIADGAILRWAESAFADDEPNAYIHMLKAALTYGLDTCSENLDINNQFDEAIHDRLQKAIKFDRVSDCEPQYAVAKDIANRFDIQIGGK
jgi:ParB/RepB/Spo0J family partition protein